MDRGLSISVIVEEHPPSAASWELSTAVPGSLESLQDVRLKADAPGTESQTIMLLLQKELILQLINCFSGDS